MLGPLHVEMAALRMQGEWLSKSGWTTLLVDSKDLGGLRVLCKCKCKCLVYSPDPSLALMTLQFTPGHWHMY